MVDEQSKKRVLQARTQLILKKPFWGYLAIHLEPKQEEAGGTAGTDGETLYYNPEFINSLSLQECIGIVAHEASHAAFGDIWRKGHRDPFRWNIAADAVRNAALTSEGFMLPAGGVYIDGADKISVEEMYHQLKSQPPQESNAEGSGNDEGNGTQVTRNGHPVKGKVIDDHGKWGKKKKDAKLQQEWREHASRASQMAKMQGSTPGRSEELLTELLEPQMEWRELLRNFVMSQIKTDYRIVPPSKKHLYRGMYLPSTHGEKLDIVFAVDTSGSMSTRELTEALTEIHSICEQFTPFTIWYVQCDTDIQEIVEISTYSNTEIPDRMKGRGGTSFPTDTIAREIMDRGGSPSVMIYFTDGYSSCFGEDPGYPVLWLLCEDNNGFKPPFGTIIKYERRSE